MSVYTGSVYDLSASTSVVETKEEAAEHSKVVHETANCNCLNMNTFPKLPFLNKTQNLICDKIIITVMCIP